ncbi:hypothetical protein ES703_108190 [subsurface metagenome]
MPEVNITDTEINPTDVVGYGGGRKEPADTELSPTYKYDLAIVITETEINPAYRLPKDTQTMGKTKGFDFRGKGFRI